MSITVTEKAIDEIKKVMDEQKFTPDTHVLEVGVVGGGCSGFSYSLGFKEEAQVDKLNSTIVNQHGVTVVLNNKVVPLIEGTTVDFHSELNKRGFTFSNPQSVRGCGCGNSFSV